VGAGRRLAAHQPNPAQFVLASDPGDAAQVRCQVEDLPVASDSVDAVLLPHTLERVREPHRLLREVERVLVGEGCVIVLGFHSSGLWAWRQRLGTATPWMGHYLRASRLREWLTVLGFETVVLRHYLFRPPFARGGLVRSAFLDRWHWRVTASAYMLVARKRVFGMTPLRLKRVKPKRAFADVVKPSVR